MSRINVVDPKTAAGEVKQLLDGVQQQLGVVPNFIRALANSPKALSAFLGLYGPLGGAAVDKATQERIALVVAEENGCQYCVIAHEAVLVKAGMSREQIQAAARIAAVVNAIAATLTAEDASGAEMAVAA